MSYAEEIDKALVAHGAWKLRLKSAIGTGNTDIQVSQVQTDNHCEFGKWFYRLPVPVRTTELGLKVQDLHARFHVEAALVLDLALKGRREEAVQAIALGSRYATISGQLALSLSQWKNALAGK